MMALGLAMLILAGVLTLIGVALDEVLTGFSKIEDMAGEERE